jgi:hypothetical protein
MSVNFTFEANTDQVVSKLQDLTRKQIPFAMALATTRTAVKLRDQEITREYRKRFETRNAGFIKLTHRVFGADVRSTKQTGIAVASIQPVDDPVPKGASMRGVKGNGTKKTIAGTQFMKRHVTGGVKTPKGSKLAVPLPSSGVTRRKGGQKAGAINNAFQPKSLLAKPKYFQGTSKKTGKGFIGKRTGGKRNRGIKVMYSYEPSVRIQRRYNPLAAAKAGIMPHFKYEFTRGMIRAMKTAKMR